MSNYNVNNGAVRFRKAPYRFRVTANSTSVYKRETDPIWGSDTEYVITGAEATNAKRRNSRRIAEARKAINNA